MEGVRSTECPRSLVEQREELKGWIVRYIRWLRLEVPPYGPDLSKWPARAVDVMDVLKIEDIRHERALEEARRSEE